MNKKKYLINLNCKNEIDESNTFISIDNELFSEYKDERLRHIDFKYKTSIHKEDIIKIYFNIQGKIDIQCDITGDFFIKNVVNSHKLLISRGLKFDTNNDDIWYIPNNFNLIDISSILYDLCILSIPVKNINKKNQYIETLELKNKRYKDPRWDKLKNLIKKN